MTPHPLIIITGPTAAGKTAISIKLAERFGGEIISADSRQVYTGLDIGTGKVTQEEMNDIPHYGIDIAEPYNSDNKVTSVSWSIHATEALQKINDNGTLPIICGGTGFYIDTLLGRTKTTTIPATPDSFIHEQQKRDATSILNDIQELNPQRAKELDPHNIRRLIRALYIEKALQQGKKIDSKTAIGAGHHTKINAAAIAKNYNPIIWIGICPTLPELRTAITTRLRTRCQNGMLTEAQLLHAQGLTYERMKELGLEYAYMAKILETQEQSPADAHKIEQRLLAELETKIWQYAKRQLTWHKRNRDIKWFHPHSYQDIENYVATQISAIA